MQFGTSLPARQRQPRNHRLRTLVKTCSSKLLKCGLCGSPMVISGGSSTRRYRCSDYIKRGTCSNALSVREDILRKRLLEELLHTLARPSGLAFARKCIAEDLGEVERQRRSRLTELRQHAAEVERKLDALLAFVAHGHARCNRAALGAGLEAPEAEKVTAERAIRAVERQSVAPVCATRPGSRDDNRVGARARWVDPVWAARKRMSIPFDRLRAGRKGARHGATPVRLSFFQQSTG